MKTALITGAARGIGLATSKRLLAAGYAVAMVDKDADALTLAAEQVAHEHAHPHIVDVSDPEAVTALSTELSRWPQLNALVNNAGIADFGPIEETSFTRWRAVMANNLDAPFLMTQAFTPLLKAGPGAVVNITSISGLRASTLRVAYGTSKAGLAHLTQQQAVELGEYGIRVNAVAPGPVRTKLAMAVHTPEIIAAYHDAVPLNRYGSEDEIAAAIAFLLSDDASYITGQMLAADGGFEATGIGLPALRS